MWHLWPLVSALTSVLGALLTLWKTMKILKTVGSVVVAIGLVVVAVESETDGKGQGAEKKQKAQEKIKEILDPHLPDFANPIVYQAAGYLVDGLVALANRTGFFGSSAVV